MSVTNRYHQPSAYHQCCCGCGRHTRKRFFPGCDPGLYGRLRRAIAAGDRVAKIIYRYVYKNNRPRTFPRQRQLLLGWVASQGS